MTNQAFITPLKSRGILAVSGEDRHNFLQGLISNDINLCKAGAAIYAALLTPQGKFLHDLFIIEQGESFLIDCEAERAGDLMKRFTMYKLRAKVMLENAVSEYDIWAAWGDDAPHNNGITYTDPRGDKFGQRLIIKKGATPVGTITGFDVYDEHRIRLGAPDGSRDMEIGKSTLLDGNFDLLNGVSWTKGCYIGQELTARMHYRALIKKRLTPVQFDGAPPAPGTAIESSEVEASVIRSSCRNIGLALLPVIAKDEDALSQTVTYRTVNGTIISRLKDNRS